jgi:choline kinase
MRGIILAAGVASRLRPLTNTTPKCLLKVGGKTILEQTIEGLIQNGIRDIVIVTGYLADQIRLFMAGKFPDLQVTYVHNPQYETTNNIFSLWLTREHVLGHDMLLLDSDIVFDPRIIGLLVRSGHETCLAVRSDHKLGQEEIKVRVQSDGTIAAIGKEIEPREAIGESIGIELFGASFVRELFNILDRMIVTEQRVNIFYEVAFEEAVNLGLPIVPVDVGGFRCMEIDTAEDLERAALEVVPFLPG